MAEILFSALSVAFLLVRFTRGPWMRNPQYVAAATIGGVGVSLAVNAIAPDMANDIITGTIAGGLGAWAGIKLFDLILNV